MDRRRALLGGGKKPPLYVYKPGFTSFQNNSGASGSASILINFSSSYVKIYSYEDYPTYHIQFNEAIYKGYEKLIVTANASRNDSNFKLYWNTGATNGGISVKLTKTIQEFVFDISADSGTRFLHMTPYWSSEFNFYDIHFE